MYPSVANKIECLCQILRSNNRTVSRRYEDQLRPLNLTNSQFGILWGLHTAQSIRLGILAEKLGMQRTTLTRELKPLERRSLISSQTDEQDQRIRLLSLSEEGESLLQEALPLWRKAQTETLAKISSRELDQLNKILEKLAS